MKIAHEFTVTLKPQMYHFKATEQFDKTAPYMKSILRGFEHTTVAELTMMHNIHYHSIVNLSVADKVVVLDRLRLYHKELGRSSLSLVQFYDSYRLYLTKSIQNTIGIVNRDPVLQDDFEVFKKAPLVLHQKTISITGAPMYTPMNIYEHRTAEHP